MSSSFDNKPRAPLTRSGDDVILTGICAGLANHLGVSAKSVRITIFATSFLGGAGAIFYLFLLATMPSVKGEPLLQPLKNAFTAPNTTKVSEANQNHFWQKSGSSPVVEILLGGALFIAAITLIAARIGIGLRVDVILPGIAVVAGVGLTWWFISDKDRTEKYFLPRTIAALTLVAAGILMFFVTRQDPNIITVVTAAFAVLLGIGLALAPWLLRLSRDLTAERSARARSAERAEIAAHLHDSVLQTLALIQQRAEPGTEVARLARNQERELREWLFHNSERSSGTVENKSQAARESLRSHAALLEDEYSARFEIIAVGATENASEEILAAAKEAMLNAAKHAGGDISVYLEVTAAKITIDVTDRGPGFNPDASPESRLGVRESILGRMERSGGSATIKHGPGMMGTTWHLVQPLQIKSNAEV